MDIFSLLFLKTELANSSARIFCFMDYLASIFINYCCTNFFKNQTRPIINLAKASERFGRGEDIGEYRPSGH